MSKLASVLLTMIVGLSIAGTAASEPLAYVVGALANTGVSTIVQTDTLFLVDLATGEAVIIGQVQSADCPGAGGGVCSFLGGISIDPLTGTLYAVSDIGDLLITIDPSTAQATVIDVLSQAGTPFPSIAGFGLTHDAAATLYFAASSGRRLSVIDPATAFVSDIAAGGGAPNTQAIADADATHLWAIRRLIGAGNYDLISVRKVAPGEAIPVDFITSIGGISPAPGGDTLGLDLAPDGTLWGVQRGPSLGGGELFQLNTTTAAMSGITEITVPASSQLVVNPSSLSILPSPAVPTLVPALLGLLAVSIMAFAARRLSQAY